MHLHIHRMSRRLPKAAEGGGDGGTHGHRESAPSVRPPANLTACETSRRRFRAYACTTSPGVRPREVLPPNCASCDPNRKQRVAAVFGECGSFSLSSHSLQSHR